MNFLRRTIHEIRMGSAWWMALSIGISLLIVLVLLPIVLSLFQSGNAAVNSESLNAEVVGNSLLLCLTVGSFCLLIGISSAWMVTQYDFPLRNFFNWSLFLPLTIPGYIMAYAYSGIFNYAGPFQNWLRTTFSNATADYFYFDFLRLPFLILVLGFALFPYVFIAAKTAFNNNTRLFQEAAESLGKTKRQVFFKIVLPLARPAIIAGFFLVIMEVLSDYGASSYFGYRTFTTAIFRAWTFDLTTALHYSALLVFVVFGLIYLEKRSRGNANYEIGKSIRSYNRIPLKGIKRFFATLFCSILFLFTFLIPFMYLLYHALIHLNKVLDYRYLQMISNSFLLAFYAALLTLTFALIIAYNRHLHRGKFSNQLSNFATVGYTLPGAIIAVGILAPSTFLDQFISQASGQHALWITGSLGLLIFAYAVRFLAVAYQPIQSGLLNQSKLYSDTSRSLGKSPLTTFLKVDVPLLYRPILAAAILVFIDVLKELPLTLILRPFNFETLATETYRYAKVMESIPQSSISAIIIIGIGLIPVLFINKLIKQS